MCILLIRKTALSIKEPVMDLELFLYQSLVLIGILVLIHTFRHLLKWLKKKLTVMPIIKKIWKTAFTI